ncbi:putative delta(7)-sterol 5(6)-desaturase [Helianthus annuus]|uniref:Delta(7)-sterol 5(6)-desaturase n=1 Tax=Helianthus annuus TaxID=4232 RepID=A0A9K3H1D6_HELAN|nr:putative delta(7)-sterol 5(6)-desaturase [Helianthus annuus]KAJ0472206.1 putative delta(7)-sterol 5(6)-desaturase [Helianthus annuus]KAJ0647803.1 putative delta(7)-sterol 5(6)-desaturase [Helianthus annuus]KAJ0651670.1 putative delta(7)-sterol 5(6)-desaturase [Helianthus annuus]
MKELEHLQLFVNETSVYNQLVIGNLLPEKLWTPAPHLLQGWLRNFIAATFLYLFTGLIWCFYIYHFKRNLFVRKG